MSRAILVYVPIVTTFATAALLSLSERWRPEASADRDRQRVVVKLDQRP